MTAAADESKSHTFDAIDPKDVDYGSLFDLTGQRHIVVGAGMGIGAATTRLIRHLGAEVMAVDIDEDRAKAIAAEVDGPWASADATDSAGVAHIVEVAKSELGPANGFVDIIGHGRVKPISEFTMEDWQWSFRINVDHAFLLGQAFGPIIAESSPGSMVFVASTAGLYALAQQPGYGPAKAALMTWVKSLAQEFGPSGVRVNAVIPGPILTPRLLEQYIAVDPKKYERMARGSFLNRLGQPHEIAGAATFLLCRAAGYITGQSVPVEGGAMSRNPHQSPTLEA